MPYSYNGNQTAPIRRIRRRRGLNSGPGRFFLFVFIVIAIAGGFLYYTKYAPTRKKMPLTEYYHYAYLDQAALIVDDSYTEAGAEAGEGQANSEKDAAQGEAAADEAQAEGEDAKGSGESAPDAVVRDGRLFLSAKSLKEYIDDGYVFDDAEQVARYATESDLISVPYNSDAYTIDGEERKADYPIILQAYGVTYLAADFAMDYSDFTYRLSKDPYRALVYNAGFSHDVAEVKWGGAIRKLGGPKSKILASTKRKDKLSVLEKFDKWSKVVSQDGVIGFIENRKLKEPQSVVEIKRLPERVFAHKVMGKRFSVGWQIITYKESNSVISQTLQGGVPDVLCPTWYRLSDDEGGISDISSKEYVKACHDRGIQVWGLVSDFENPEVDVAKVLNSTAARDHLVEGLMNAAAASGIDGINVDFEKVPAGCGDGYSEFIRHLSLECEKQDLFISVDNYIPASYNQHYNREAQDDFADYVIVMAYDEHHKGGGEAGSNASLPFVREACEATLKEVEPARLVLGMPLYCREWIDGPYGLNSMEYTMRQVPTYLNDHRLNPIWDKDLGQYYTEFADKDEKHMLWIEDERSLEKKMELMSQYKLAGGAFWAMGFEKPEVWEMFAKYR